MRRLFGTLVLVGALAAPHGAAATPTPGQDMAAKRMSEFSVSKPPIGYLQFCEVYPDDCGTLLGGPDRVPLTAERWEQLAGVNDRINNTIEPATDMEIYGVAEFWTYPYDRGDCEDYVLLKRKILLERGWPASSLLITVVRDQQGEGHAVLTVTTSDGDFILDNQETEIHRWHDTPYGFLRRQSEYDPNIWVSLRDDRSRPEMPVAGMDRH